MSDTKHTPGPWHAKFGGDSEGFTIAQRGDSGLIVCEYWPATPDLRHVGDARLIAAAPDLLAAAKDLIDWIEGKVATDVPAAFRGLSLRHEAIRAAIAKATGEVSDDD